MPFVPASKAAARSPSVISRVLARKIELGEVTVQVRLADVVECAVDAALQQREMALDGVGVRKPAEPHILFSGVVDAGMPGELGTDRRINPAVIGHQVRLAIRVLDQDRT